MQGSVYYKALVLGWLWLLALPALGEQPEAMFLELKIDPPVIRLEAELPYTGPPDQQALRRAAEQRIAGKLGVSPDGGPPLTGPLTEVRLGPATQREDISAEALGEDPKQSSLKAVWEYPYPQSTAQLELSSEIQEPAYFVTYHLGVRIHDRAPLKAKQTLSLDWEDPWYSRFVQPDLARTPAESISCFLYLEPGQTRVEVLARARDLQAVGKLDLGSEDLLSTDKQSIVAEQYGKILQSQLSLKVNERPLDLQLQKVHFVKRTPTSADAIVKPEPIPASLATLGAVLVGPAITEGGNLKLRCQLFSPRVKEIPVFVVEGDKLREVKLVPNEEGLITIDAPPETRALTPVSAPQSTSLAMVLLSAGGILLLGGILMFRGGVGSKAFSVGSVLWLVAGAVAVKWGFRAERLPPKAPLQSLLQNVYQAFEAPTEEAVYDRLAVSVEGELLSEVYLQTRKGLEAEQGVQVSVERVNVESATVVSSDWWGDGLKVKALWEVSGRVGHWGHEHQRSNWYRAELKLKSVGGHWKLTELEVLDEIRM